MPHLGQLRCPKLKTDPAKNVALDPPPPPLTSLEQKLHVLECNVYTLKVSYVNQVLIVQELRSENCIISTRLNMEVLQQ